MQKRNDRPAQKPGFASGHAPVIGLSREAAAAAIGVSPRTIDTLIADRTSALSQLKCRVGKFG